MIRTSGAVLALVGSDAAWLGVTITDCSFAAATTEGPGRVQALGRRMAGRTAGATLIHVDASVGTWDVALGAAALTGHANLAGGRTVCIRATAWPAAAVHANFTRQTIVVAVANLDALAGQATLASSTAAAVTTNRVAAARLARHAGRAGRIGLAVNGTTDATLLGRRSAHEAGWAGALGRSVDDAAEGARAADTFALARILAAMIQTILVDGAVRFDAAAGRTEAADASLARQTLIVAETGQLAHVGGTPFALGAVLVVATDGLALTVHARTSAAIGLRPAALRSTDTASFGVRVRVEARRARAAGLVVGGAAQGVDTAVAAARIHATAVVADGFGRAVHVSVRASSVSPAASAVGIADAIDRAGAVVPSALDGTSCRRVARLG